MNYKLFSFPIIGKEDEPRLCLFNMNITKVQCTLYILTLDQYSSKIHHNVGYMCTNVYQFRMNLISVHCDRKFSYSSAYLGTNTAIVKRVDCAQQTHYVETTSYLRRSNAITLHRRRYGTVLMLRVYLVHTLEHSKL